MTHLINNFVDTSPIEIDATRHPRCGNLVNITQRGAGMSFQHSMTPEQARALAAILIEAASSLEAS